MQKSTQKASILIWSIFLSIIISISFMSISTKINETLKNNSKIQDNISTSGEIKNILSDNLAESQELSDGKYIDITPLNTYIGSFEKNETKQFSFSGTNLDYINIDLKNGGPIKYNYKVGTNPQENNILNYSSVSFSGNLNTTDTHSILTVENLGGYSLVGIEADGNMIAPERNYDLWKKIGNKNVIIQSGIIN